MDGSTPAKKKAYHAPVLRVYGDIRRLTETQMTSGTCDGRTTTGMRMTDNP